MTNVRFDQVKVQWYPILHQFANGRLLGYTVYYIEYYNWVVKSVSTSNPYANMLILRGLKAATRYELAVAAFTSKGPGPRSHWLYITTGDILCHSAGIFIVNFKILFRVNTPAPRSFPFILNLGYLFIYSYENVYEDRMMNSEQISNIYIYIERSTESLDNAILAF